MQQKYVDIDRFCEITGLAKRTVYILNYRGDLDEVVIKFGPRLLRFREDHIYSWMENRRQRFLERKVQLTETQ